MQIKHIIICYDIKEDKTRTLVIKCLEHYDLHRIQYSVFIGAVKPKLLKKMMVKLETIINTTEDKVYSFEVPERALVNSKMLGIFTDIESIIKPPTTLII